jgi:hypothetical protein
MGSVSDKKFQELLAAVLGDERQKQLMGLSDDDSGGLPAVVDVMDLILKRRKAAVADLFKRQAIPGSGVTNEQVNRAVSDYEESSSRHADLAWRFRTETSLSGSRNSRRSRTQTQFEDSKPRPVNALARTPVPYPLTP